MLFPNFLTFLANNAALGVLARSPGLSLSAPSSGWAKKQSKNSASASRTATRADASVSSVAALKPASAGEEASARRKPGVEPRQQNDHHTVPDCEADAEALPNTDDLNGGAFPCPAHGRFEVSATALTAHRQKGILDWERALERAQARASTGSRPRIEDKDFL